MSLEKVQAQKPTRLSLEMARKKDREMVKGVFKFYEVPGGTMNFSFKKYKEDPVENFSLVDGQIYTIPRGVAKHLVNDCWYPEYDFIKGEDVRSNYAVKNKTHRCGFQSLEFMDEDMQTESKSILEVSKI